MTVILRSLPLLLVQLLVAHASSSGNTIVAFGSGRWLQDDHAHELKFGESLMWAGIFQFSANKTYNLTVRAPDEESDPHAGHNHRRLAGRKLQDDDHSGHDHGDNEGHSDHAEEGGAHFLLALVPVSASGQEGIDQAIASVDSMQNKLVNVEDGDAIVGTTSHGYELYIHNPQSTSTLTITNSTQQHYVLFLADTPSQVSGDAHFLVDEEGAHVWPQTARYYTPPDPRDLPKPWGKVIGATLLVNLVTLIGVVFLVPMLTTAFKNKTLPQAWKDLTSSTDIQLIGGRTQHLFDMCITAFACGALLATCVFLIIPEAMVLVNAGDEEGDSHEGHNHRMLQGDDDHAGHDHGDKNWVFGTSVLAGFLFPMFLASFFPHHHGHGEAPHTHETHHTTVGLTEEPKIEQRASSDDPEVIQATDDNANSTEESEVDNRAETEGAHPTKKKEVKKRLVVGILLGDALHNFADGVFVGTAFLLCSDALAWSVLAGTIYHELAQEVSDFFVLTTHGHLPPIKALALNFLSGLSVTLGGIVVLGTNVTNYALGVILSMSAGVYINVAAKECMPIVERLAVTAPDRLMAFFFFSIGAIPIGLVLLNHQHCEA